MDRLINELIHCLIEEKSIYNKYLALSGLKQDAVIKCNITGLEKIIEEENMILNEMSLLENKRSVIVSGISDNKNITVAEIACITKDEGLKNRLNSHVTELKEIIEKIKEVNQTNCFMIQCNLNYIDYMLNSVMTEDSTYSCNGTEGLKQKLNIFDKRV